MPWISPDFGDTTAHLRAGVLQRLHGLGELHLLHAIGREHGDLLAFDIGHRALLVCLG